MRLGHRVSSLQLVSSRNLWPVRKECDFIEACSNMERDVRVRGAFIDRLRFGTSEGCYTLCPTRHELKHATI
jgi:hypothetical protein